MRFITMVKSVDKSVPFPEAFENAMAKFREETIKDGALIDGSRLFPSEAGARVRLSGGKLTVTDGPFAETKEVVGGYGVYEFRSKKEAIEFTLRFMHLLKEHWPGWEGETEIRQLFDESCAGLTGDGMHGDRVRQKPPNHIIEKGRVKV